MKRSDISPANIKAVEHSKALLKLNAPRFIKRSIRRHPKRIDRSYESPADIAVFQRFSRRFRGESPARRRSTPCDQARESNRLANRTIATRTRIFTSLRKNMRGSRSGDARKHLIVSREHEGERYFDEGATSEEMIRKYSLGFQFFAAIPVSSRTSRPRESMIATHKLWMISSLPGP